MKSIGRPLGVLVDLQGPKLRVGKFADGKVQLKTGQTFHLDLSDEPGTAERAHLPHPEIFKALEASPICCSTTARSACG